MTTSIKTFTFPKCSVEALPVNEVISNIITATEAGSMVDNLSDSWFGQLLVYGRNAVVKAGKSVTSYEDAAKTVGDVVDVFKSKIKDELVARQLEIERGTHTKEEQSELLTRLDSTRAKIDNSLKSGKSVIVNCLKHGEHVLSVVTDGGHILFKKDGTPRGKTALQNLLKQAKAAAQPKKSEVEQALDAAAHLARKMVPLSAADRKMVMTSLTAKMRELDSERDDIEIEDEAEELAEAA